MKRLSHLLLPLLLAVCMGGGCATHPKPPAIIQPVILEPGDSIQIRFSSFNDDPSTLPPPIHRIDDQGNVSLSLVGPIRVAGLTSDQAAAKIHDAYVPKYFPQLTVEVEKVASSNKNQ